MKLVKSLMLGSAAGLVVMSGAQAADLPVKAKAVEYVKVCSLYGAGFYYIPGTDTCIKVGGYLRAEIDANTNSTSGTNFSGAGGAANRFTNDYTWRGRSAINIDTRTATEYGVVRTFALTTFSWTTDTYAGNSSAAGSTVYSSIGGTAAPGNASSGAGGSGAVGVQFAYLQFAGFTIGRAISEFSSPWQNYPANNVDILVGGASSVVGVSQFTYTGQFGNGVSAAISVQDPSSNFQAGVNNLSATGASFYGTSDYAGTIAPDIIGTATVDQAWGYFKFSVAAHDNHAAYYGLTEDTGHPGDRWGWAAQGALQIKNIPTGPGDDIKIQGVYTDGATRFNIQDLASAFSSAGIYGSTSVPGAYESIGFGTAPDTVFAKGTQQYLIKTWGMNAGFNHNWDPYWSSGLYGAYAGVRYGSGAKNLICNTSGIGFAVAAGAGVTTCNPDYSISQAGIITRWTPVKNLTFSGDLTWSHIDQQYSGTITQSASASIGKPSATYELKSQSNVTLLFRAQRDF